MSAIILFYGRTIRPNGQLYHFALLHGIIARMRLLYHWGRGSEGSKARFCPGAARSYSAVNGSDMTGVKEYGFD